MKYFKAYALKHFAEEETYMRQIGYSGCLTHKRLHDRMRRETLPALERGLHATDSSLFRVNQDLLAPCIDQIAGPTPSEQQKYLSPARYNRAGLFAAFILASLAEPEKSW